MTTRPQPGWYDDPDDPNAQRHWDGQNWTPYRKRKPTPRPAQPPVAASPQEQYSPRPGPPPPPPPLPPPPPAHLPPPPTRGLPAIFDSNFVAKLRTNQLAVYLVAGGLGGLAGALLGEVEASGPRYYTSTPQIIMRTSLWSGLFTSVLAVALVIAAEWYQRHQLRPGRVAIAFLFGALAGAFAGAIAELIFQQRIGSIWFQNYVLRSFCWGLAGSLIGAFLSRAVPNLGLIRGSVAGFIGGAVGGISFVLIAGVLPETLGRLVGIAALGTALGFAMYAVEHLFREASVEVIWAPNESTRVSLGAQPVTIGGGEDHIFLRGLPEHVAAIVFQNGQLEYVESSTGTRTPLTDGSRFAIGPVELLVHAAK
jgi:drug/metabolite transporter (DMT)-like permease